jgi:hypothetical protein
MSKRTGDLWWVTPPGLVRALILVIFIAVGGLAFSLVTSCKRSDTDGVTDLGPLASLTNLRALYLTGADGVTDLGPLASLTNLQALYLSDADGDD